MAVQEMVANLLKFPERIERPALERNHRVSLEVVPQDVKYDELLPLFESWEEEFGMKFERIGSSPDGASFIRFPLSTRREFSLVPVIIRKALRLGYDLGIHSSEYSRLLKDGSLAKDAAYDDIDFYGHIGLDHCDFWKVLALGQMWYEK